MFQKLFGQKFFRGKNTYILFIQSKNRFLDISKINHHQSFFPASVRKSIDTK